MKFNCKNFLVIFLLLSPSFSITQSVFGVFFPNEKIAFLLVLLQSLFSRYLINNLTIIKPFFIITPIFVFLALIHSYIGEANITTLNMAYIFLAMPIWIIYFRKNLNLILNNFSYIIIVNLCVSVIQQYNCILDAHSINAFNNYHHQIGYIFPENGFGLFRTSGLFNESSQYSVLLAIFVILYFKKIIERTSINKCIAFLSFFDLVINQSSSVLIISFFYILHINFKETKNSIFFLLTLFISPLIFDSILIKITRTMSMDSNLYPRLINSIQSFNYGIENHFFFGNGLSWDRPTWDIFSIYFSGFGIFGFLTIIFFIIICYKKSPFLFPFFISTVLINGNLLVSINIFLIAIIFNYKFLANENIRNNSYLQ
jgi:hypothetical protein